MSSKPPTPEQIHALVIAVRDNIDEMTIKVRKIKCKDRRCIVVSSIVDYIMGATNITTSDAISVLETIKLNTFMGSHQRSDLKSLLSQIENNQGINIPSKDVGVG